VTTSSAAGIADTTVSLSTMLKRAVVDANEKSLGRIEDATTLLRDGQYPLLTGLVICVDGSRFFVPASSVISIAADPIRLRSAHGDLSRFERRDGEVLLKQEVLGHRFIDLDRSALVRAYDIRLVATTEGWNAHALDVHKYRWFQFGAHANHPARDWHAFLPLIGGQKSLRTHFALRQIQSLKPAQIADIIEGASVQEQDELLAQVHADPELEADVFEELDEDEQSRLLKTRSDRDVADVLSRMRADDAADAVMDLPQKRRRTILDLLPQPQNTKVLALLGYHDATAGGLMGTDYLALPEYVSIAEALEKLRTATTQQPEALTTIHSLHSDGTLAGTLGLVRALQLDAATLLREAADPHIVVAAPEDDIISVTTRMADFNLLSLPVLDPSGRILGIITVDDALEAAIPRDWYQREPGNPTPHPRKRRNGEAKAATGTGP
jgi:CBS domain-containing protein